MIPHLIHYCWFGRNPLPDLAVRCIESWKRFFPDYEIIEWNEDNFDVSAIAYTREAYAAKKYAFVSDYARFWILYQYGGLYFDTDVEVIRPMDDLVARGPFMGCEKPFCENAGPNSLGVAPGLGLGAVPGSALYREIVERYSELHFLQADGSQDKTTVVEHITGLMVEHGLKNLPEVQQCAGVWIYPNDYFAPKNIDTNTLTITPNTRSIHHYDASWAEWYDKAAGIRGPKLRRLFGRRLGDLLNRAIYARQRFGWVGCLKKLLPIRTK